MRTWNIVAAIREEFSTGGLSHPQGEIFNTQLHLKLNSITEDIGSVSIHNDFENNGKFNIKYKMGPTLEYRFDGVRIK